MPNDIFQIALNEASLCRVLVVYSLVIVPTLLPQYNFTSLLEYFIDTQLYNIKLVVYTCLDSISKYFIFQTREYTNDVEMYFFPAFRFK